MDFYNSEQSFPALPYAFRTNLNQFDTWTDYFSYLTSTPSNIMTMYDSYSASTMNALPLAETEVEPPEILKKKRKSPSSPESDHLGQVRDSDKRQQDKFNTLQEEKSSLEEQNNMLAKEIASLEEQNNTLQENNHTLKKKVVSLEGQNAKLREQLTFFKKKLDDLQTFAMTIFEELGLF
ncbi:hypothetical protein B0I35DRAFT_415539 [Stachybotrys elegans]|uniref:BZIP domain-containing protein n=1 Tax=Stachybotrys elegans TaxID=80388 RepID=A0A8K0SCP4_9HYPO|nr:hypothetical protein B0I35DRAFT_415539 [Stachybotrys elegans]